MLTQPIADDSTYRRTAIPPFRQEMTLVSRCICRDRNFTDLLPLARRNGWTLTDLMSETGAGAQCGLCRPYLRRMLRTGETEFRELLSADDG